MNKTQAPQLFKIALISTKGQRLAIPFSKTTHTGKGNLKKLSSDFHSYIKKSSNETSLLFKFQTKFFKIPKKL